jgi:hypothetical protein
MSANQLNYDYISPIGQPASSQASLTGTEQGF